MVTMTNTTHSLDVGRLKVTYWPGGGLGGAWFAHGSGWWRVGAGRITVVWLGRRLRDALAIYRAASTAEPLAPT